MENKLETLREWIEKSKRIVVFTGAGISVPSGIPDFRSADGIYNQKTNINIPPEEIISHTFFLNHTKEFYEFYFSKMVYPNALPNAAHKFFADLEAKGKEVSVVTQNIDGLHQMAGSKYVYELHGSVHRNYCMNCSKSYLLTDILGQKIPRCSCGGMIKPDVVLYEEPLNDYIIRSAIRVIQQCDLLIVIGTSLTVYPAASFVQYYLGDKLVLLNKTKTPYDNYANLVINDDCVSILNKIK